MLLPNSETSSRHCQVPRHPSEERTAVSCQSSREFARACLWTARTEEVLCWVGWIFNGLGVSDPVQSAFGLPPVHVTQESLATSDTLPNLGLFGLNEVLGGGVLGPGVLAGSLGPLSSSPAMLVESANP